MGVCSPFRHCRTMIAFQKCNTNRWIQSLIADWHTKWCNIVCACLTSHHTKCEVIRTYYWCKATRFITTCKCVFFERGYSVPSIQIDIMMAVSVCDVSIKTHQPPTRQLHSVCIWRKWNTAGSYYKSSKIVLNLHTHRQLSMCNEVKIKTQWLGNTHKSQTHIWKHFYILNSARHYDRKSEPNTHANKFTHSTAQIFHSSE